MRAEQCGRCGAEVRFGVRQSAARTPADQDAAYWMHRDPADDIDHAVILGTPWTPALQAKLDESLAAMAERGKADDAKKKQEKEAEEKDVWAEVPAPEVLSHPITKAELRPRSGVLQMFNLVSKTPDWEVRRLTASRGPYVGARGQVLSISDAIVMGMRGPTLDGATQVAVASWRDYKFDFAWTGMMRNGIVATQPANSEGLKTFIRGE